MEISPVFVNFQLNQIENCSIQIKKMKDGMPLHANVFFLKKNNHLFKRLYLSSINQCDQGMIDTLSLGKAVLKQLKVDEPQIQKLFAKSDNASCYHGNYLPQALYQLCKEQDITLVRYDYNEPCKGKDQCDYECVRYWRPYWRAMLIQ